MDSIEVAVRFTEAIMAKSRVKEADLAESYVDMFAEVLKRVNMIMNPASAASPPQSPRTTSEPATSEIFPLTHDRRE